jgi:hypothetical protein
VKLIVGDGDGEKMRTYEAKSNVGGAQRRAGKIGDINCFRRKSARSTEARWETWVKSEFSARIH